MVKNKKKEAKQEKDKSTFEKFIWTSGEKYKIFVWDGNIQKAFIAILIVTIVLLSMLAYTQNNLINEMKKRSSYIYYEDVTPELIALEDFVSQTGIASGAISDLASYFEGEGYNVALTTGILQATKDTCDEHRICTQTVYRFNQKKGLYLDKYTVESYKKKR